MNHFKYMDEQNRHVKALTMSGRGLSWRSQSTIVNNLYQRGYRGWVYFVKSNTKKGTNIVKWYASSIPHQKELFS